MGRKVEHGSLPTRRTKEGFNPNAYKLLAKAGYDPRDKTTLVPPEVTWEKTYGITATQN